METAASFSIIDAKYAGDMVLQWPMSSMGTPVDIEVGLTKIQCIDDECGAGKVTGRANDFGRVPAILMHDPSGIIDILDGVLGLDFFDQG